MATDKIDSVSISTQANVYFDGKCVSHGITLADGTKKSVGVILPATLTFNTGAPEIMETVAGACEVLLPGANEWQRFGAGESFKVPGKASFQIRVTGEPYHYICHFG
jgi:purine/pyrimidine-nucleoside phosphorylase